MYSRYNPQSEEKFVPAAYASQFAEKNEKGHGERRDPVKHTSSPLAGLAGLFGGGKNPLGGFFKGLRRRDGGDLDMTDIILLLILLLLFMEEGGNDLFIILAVVLILGI